MSVSCLALSLVLVNLVGLISGYDPNVPIPTVGNTGVGEGTDYMRREHSLIKPYQGE